MKNVLAILALLFYAHGYSQSTEKIEQQFPIHIAVLNESTSFPDLSFLNYSYNPGVLIGTEYLLKRKKNHDWHLTGNLGFYYNKNWQAATFLTSEIGYRYQLNRWSFSPRVGMGYSHNVSTKPTYQFVDGKFQEKRNLGSPAFITSLAMNIGFDLNKSPSAPQIYMTYSSTVEMPFSIYTGLHHFVGLGYKFYPFSKK